jgi:small subunit ribosomal protein S9
VRDFRGGVHGIGGRKSARAQAYIKPGPGEFSINGKPLIRYFRSIENRRPVLEPLVVTDTLGRLDVNIKVEGGGYLGQSEAIRHAISNALLKFEPEYRLVLKRNGFLTRDSRVVERKKTGQKKARKKFQWVKR